MEGERFCCDKTSGGSHHSLSQYYFKKSVTSYCSLYDNYSPSGDQLECASTMLTDYNQLRIDIYNPNSLTNFPFVILCLDHVCRTKK